METVLKREPKKSKFFIGMDELLTDTYSHIGLKIMENLSHRDLLNCKLVKKSWLCFIETECQRSSIIIRKEISFHSSKLMSIATQNSNDYDVICVMLSNLRKLLQCCRNVKELETIQWMTRKFLPISRTDITMSVKCMEYFFHGAPSVKELLKAGPDKDPSKYYSIFRKLQYEAARCENHQVFKMFACLTGTFNPCDERNFTLLHEEDISNEFKRFILDNVEDPNPEAAGGITPLHSAAYHGNFKFFMMIATRIGGHIDIKHLGKTPYEFLAGHKARALFKRSNRHVLEYIIEHSQDPNPIVLECTTPLKIAASMGCLEVFKTIAAKVVNYKNLIHFNPSPLWWPLVENDMNKVISILKETTNEEYVIAFERMLIDEIIEENNFELLRIIESHGIDIRPKQRQVLASKLQKVARQGKLEMLKLLTRKRCDILHCEVWMYGKQFGKTPFLSLSFKNKCNIFDWLSIDDKLHTLDLLTYKPKLFKKLKKRISHYEFWLNGQQVGKTPFFNLSLKNKCKVFDWFSNDDKLHILDLLKNKPKLYKKLKKRLKHIGSQH